MKLRYVIGTTLAALLAGTAGVVLSVGMGDDAWLARTPAGRWLGLRAPAAVPSNGVAPALGGQSIGMLELTDVDRRPRSLPVGRPVLVNVWASWCVPCRQEMPLLDRYAATQGASGVAVVGIAEDDAGSVGDFLRKTPVTYTILLDDGQWRAGTRLGNELGVLPFTALIDADGRLVKHRAGPFDSVQAIQQWTGTPN